MTFYHKSKEAALKAGHVFEEYWHIKVEFEVNNGWVLVLTPRSLQTFQWPWADILEVAEIDLTAWHRVSVKPREHVRKPTLKEEAPKATGANETHKPQTGSTAMVHSIADKLHAEAPLTRADRGRVIAACVAANINESTAATQWSKWAKAKGL